MIFAHDVFNTSVEVGCLVIASHTASAIACGISV